MILRSDYELCIVALDGGRYFALSINPHLFHHRRWLLLSQIGFLHLIGVEVVSLPIGFHIDSLAYLRIHRVQIPFLIFPLSLVRHPQYSFNSSQHLVHHFMNYINGFARADHDLEFCNPAIRAPSNHVHTFLLVQF